MHGAELGERGARRSQMLEAHTPVQVHGGQRGGMGHGKAGWGGVRWDGVGWGGVGWCVVRWGGAGRASD